MLRTTKIWELMVHKFGGLVFFESTHRYFLNGRELIAVTRVFEKTGITDFSKVKFDVLEPARLLGDCVHELVKLVGLKKLDRRNLDPRLEGYLGAVRKFYKENVKKVLLIEQAVCDPYNGYAGTPDLVYVDFDDRNVIDDVKTPKRPHAAWGLQTAAYKNAVQKCYPSLKIHRREGVMLRADGTYERHPHLDAQDFDNFLAALRVARFKINRKINA